MSRTWGARARQGHGGVTSGGAISALVGMHSPSACRPGRWGAFLLALLFAGAATTSAADEGAAALQLSRTVTRTLAPGETHDYAMDLTSGQYVHVSVGHSHLDIVVRLLSSAGNVLAEVDNAAGRDEPLSLSVIAQRDERARLQVRLGRDTADGGEYRLTLDSLRPREPGDERRIDGERLLAQADHLAAQGSAASLEEAAALYERLLPEWRAVGERRAEAATLARLGDIQGTVGDPRRAASSAEQALAIWRSLGDSQGEAAALTQDGLAHADMGEQRLGIEILEKALAIRRASGDARGEAEVLNDIAVALGGLGELPTAIERYTEALELARAIHDALSEALILKNRAADHEGLGEFERALADLEDSLAQFRALKNRHEEGITQYTIGNTLLHMGDEQRALDRYALALTLLRETGDHRFEAFTLNHVGLAHLAAHRPAAALEPLLRAQELLQQSGDRRAQAMILADIGRAHLESGDTPGALDRLHEALPLVRASGDRVHEAIALAILARAEEAAGNLDEARARIEESLTLTESLRSAIPSIRERTSYMAQAHARYGLLVDVLMSLYAQRHDRSLEAEGLQASERGRARGLLELLGEARVSLGEGAPAALLDEEREVASRIDAARRAEQELLVRRTTAQEAEASRRAMQSLLTEQQDVRARLRAANPKFAALVEPQPLTSREIQQQVLDADTLLLEYTLGEERSYLWAVSPTTLESHELPGRAVLEAAAREVYGDWSTPNGEVSEWAPRARALSETLLGPVAGELGRKRLVVVADGALQYLPFAALPSPSSSGSAAAPPLVAEHEVVYLPSASTLAVLRRELSGRPPAPRSVAVFADPVFDRDDPRVGIPGRAPAAAATAPSSLDLARSAKDLGIVKFDRLRASRREAAEIARVAPEPRLEALDFQASREKAMSPELGQYRIVHFASHGLLNSHDPELSGIVLSLVDEQGRARDGFFQVRDIYGLTLGADLVVLSACQTALGKEVRGEGVLGLARGFMYAGAPRVVASLWRVSDRATAELMRHFYSAMLEGHRPPAAALRAAQQAVRREPRWTSPYYWAAFTLQGEWQ